MQEAQSRLLAGRFRHFWLGVAVGGGDEENVRLLIRQLNMANKNLGGVFDSRILEVRLDTFGFAL
ncbi:MAG: hypothetical protein ACK511_12470, partial [Burkholderiales bacterium]